MSEVFISYAHLDADIAVSVKAALEGSGLSVWMDDAIQGGDAFPRAIQRELDEAECVLALWSKESVAHEFVTDEARRAERRNALLPVALEKDVEAPIGLGEVQRLTLALDNGTLPAEQLDRVVTAVRKKIETPSVLDPLRQAGNDIRKKLEEHLQGRYELVNELGRGRSSVVFRARSVSSTKVDFAIKVTTIHTLLLTDGLYQSLVSASETAAGLTHPNIVSVHNVEQKDDLLISVTRFVNGRSLKSLLLERRMQPSQVQALLVQVSGALAYAHSREVKHLDLRPSKILVDRVGTAQLADFGFAAARVPESRRSQMLVGRPTYMSPEQCSGDAELTGASDQYSLGVIAYEMLTGQPPYTGGSPMEIMAQHVGAKRRPLAKPLIDACADCPDLKSVILRMLEKKPLDRYVSMGAAVHDLHHSFAGDASHRDIAKASFARCSEMGSFLDIFYDRFIQSHPKVQKEFTGIDMDQQIGMLDHALTLILDFGATSDEVRERFKSVVDRHSKMAPQLFEMFTEALVEAVRACDASCSDEVEKAWRQIVSECEAQLRSQAQADVSSAASTKPPRKKTKRAAKKRSSRSGKPPQSSPTAH